MIQYGCGDYLGILNYKRVIFFEEKIYVHGKNGFVEIFKNSARYENYFFGSLK